MSKVCRRQLVGLVSERAGVSQKAARDLLTHVFDAIADELAKGNTVTVSGFGTWRMKVSKPRKGRDLRDGHPLDIRPRTRVTFKAGAVLRRTAESSIEPEIFFGKGVNRSTELDSVFARLSGMVSRALETDEVKKQIREMLGAVTDQEAAEFFAALSERGEPDESGEESSPDGGAEPAGSPRAPGGSTD